MLSASLLFAALAMPTAGDLDAADALRKEGRIDEAILAVQDAIKLGDGDTRTLHLKLAELYLDQGLGLQALEALSSLDTRGDHDVAVLAGRAHRKAADQVYFANGPQADIDMHFEEAIAAYERAMSLAGDDTSAGTWHLGSVYLYDDGDVAGALALAQSVLDEAPDDAYGLLLRGAANAYVYYEHSSGGDTEAANEAWKKGVDDLTRADELLPEHVTHALGQLAWYYDVQGMGMKAVDTARTILDRQSPPDFNLLYEQAKKYRGVAGGLDASGRALEKIVNTDEEALGRLIAAEQDPTTVAASLADSTFPFYQRGDRGTVRKILEAIVSSDPKDAVVWDNYAVVCTETSRFDDAVAAYERAIEIDPENPRLLNDLGAVFQHNLRRETERARELYDQCIAMADEQMNMLDATEAIRSRAREAKNVATQNLNSLQPAATAGGGSLLDDMMASLRGLNLPADGEGEDGDGEGDDGDGEDTEGDGPR